MTRTPQRTPPRTLRSPSGPPSLRRGLRQIVSLPSPPYNRGPPVTPSKLPRDLISRNLEETIDAIVISPHRNVGEEFQRAAQFHRIARLRPHGRSSFIRRRIA